MVKRSLLLWVVLSLFYSVSLFVNQSYYPQVVKIGRPIARDLSPIPIPAQEEIVVPGQNLTPEEWGVAKQIDDVTWTIKVGQDEKMATAEEILAALNSYRSRHGAGALSWDENLANYAQERAKYFTLIQNLDQHKGFIEYAESEENVRKLGFWGIGENASFGYKLEGVHLVEWVFAGDEPHDKNQLNPSWTHVGIGVDNTAVGLIFGKWRINS